MLKNHPIAPPLKSHVVGNDTLSKGTAPFDIHAVKAFVFQALDREQYELARQAAGAAIAGGAKDDILCYLHAYAIERLGDLPHAMRLAQEYLDTARTEVRKEFLQLRASVAYRIGDPQAAAFYYAAYEEEPLNTALYSSFLLAQNAQDVDVAEFFRAHCVFDQFFKDVPQYAHTVPYAHQRIRVGYLSPDFRRNVMQNFVQPLLLGYDRTSFAVYAYSLTEEPDDVTEALRPHTDVWRDMGRCSAEEIAAQIYADEIDILVDLAGHASGGALAVLARRPAPVQMLGLGYMATSGLRAVDYFLTDAACDPPEGGSEAYFTEELVRLPSQFCYVPHAHLPASEGTPARRRGP